MRRGRDPYASVLALIILAYAAGAALGSLLLAVVAAVAWPGAADQVIFLGVLVVAGGVAAVAGYELLVRPYAGARLAVRARAGGLTGGAHPPYGGDS